MKRNREATEKKILEGALKVFSEKGFSGATTKEIAKQANVSEGIIFKYYPKKKDLLYILMVKGTDLFIQSMGINTLKKIIKEKEKESIEELLKSIIMDRIQLFENHFSLIKVIFYEMQFHEELRNVFIEKIRLNFSKMIKQIFKGRKEALKNIDQKLVMRSFVGMVMAMIIQRQFIQDKDHINPIEKEVEAIVDIFLNGIRS